MVVQEIGELFESQRAHDYFQSSEYWDWIEEEWLKLCFDKEIPKYEKFKAYTTILRAKFEQMLASSGSKIQMGVPRITVELDKRSVDDVLKDYEQVFDRVLKEADKQGIDLDSKEETDE